MHKLAETLRIDSLSKLQVSRMAEFDENGLFTIDGVARV
jgi:hypothetical protein